ncbi:MAG: DUF423 domain-containing protein [Bacteroidota bacterium]
MAKQAIFWAGIMGTLAVGLGAFGAHGLEKSLQPSQLAVYKTGVTYHFYHTFGLAAVGILHRLFPHRWWSIAAACFLIGIVLFSGSLYLLSTRTLIGLENYRWLGPITPIGGLLFAVGWLALALTAVKSLPKSS